MIIDKRHNINKYRNKENTQTHTYANKWRLHILNCQSWLSKNAFSSGSVMFSQNLAAVRNITPSTKIETINYHWPEMYCTPSHSSSPKYVQMKENGHRLGARSFKTMGNFSCMQTVILQNPTQPCDFPQGTRMQLVHVAHNCIIDI